MIVEKRKAIMFGAVFIMMFGFVESGNAMHIMEGALPPAHAAVWGVICIPFLIAGIISIKKTVAVHRRTVMLLAMVGAYAFVLSSLKIPSAVTASSSHPTGTGLGAVLFGPSAMCVLGVIILLFQAILLAHGGLTTLGANTFSMAIAGPFLAFGIYKAADKAGAPKVVSVFLAAALGDLFTYLITSIQLALAFPMEAGGFEASFVKFGSIFALTQIPLAIVEGLVAVAVMQALESFAAPELEELGYLQEV